MGFNLREGSLGIMLLKIKKIMELAVKFHKWGFNQKNLQKLILKKYKHSEILWVEIRDL